MDWLSKLQGKRSRQGTGTNLDPPRGSWGALAAHLRLPPEQEQACNFLNALTEQALKDYEPERLHQALNVGNPATLAATAARVNHLADRYYQSKDYADSETIYTLQIKLLLAYLKIQFRFGDIGNGLYPLRRSPESAGTLSNLSSAYFNRGNTYDEMNTPASWQKALDDDEQALRLGNALPWDVHFNMGLVCEKMGRLAEARTHYLQSRAGAPASTEARVQRALARLG